MIIKNIKNKKKGFALLLSVVLTSIILSITLGITEIGLKELSFSTSARETNNAFFAADNGIECATFHDRNFPPSSFPLAGPATALSCGAPLNITPIYTGGVNTGTYTFNVTGLNENNMGCAKVTVFKDGVTSPPFISTVITAKGYNLGDGSCNSTNPNRIEREIRVTY